MCEAVQSGLPGKSLIRILVGDALSRPPLLLHDKIGVWTQVGLLHHSRHGSHVAVAALTGSTWAVGGVGGTVLWSVARDVILVGRVVDAQAVVRHLCYERGGIVQFFVFFTSSSTGLFRRPVATLLACTGQRKHSPWTHKSSGNSIKIQAIEFRQLKLRQHSQNSGNSIKTQATQSKLRQLKKTQATRPTLRQLD